MLRKCYRTSSGQVFVLVCLQMSTLLLLAWLELALKLSSNLENASTFDRTFNALQVAVNGTSSLHGEDPTHYKSCFAKSGSIYSDVPQGTIQERPFTQPPCTAPTPHSLGLCFGYTQMGHKGRCRAAVACFEAVHMARGLAVSRFLRQIESVSVVRAVRQTGRERPGKRCLGGVLFSIMAPVQILGMSVISVSLRLCIRAIWEGIDR